MITIKSLKFSSQKSLKMLSCCRITNRKLFSAIKDTHIGAAGPQFAAMQTLLWRAASVMCVCMCAATRRAISDETKTLQAFPNCPIRAEQRAYLLIKLFFPSVRALSAFGLVSDIPPCAPPLARHRARVIIQKTAYNSLVCALAIMRWQPHTHTLSVGAHRRAVRLWSIFTLPLDTQVTSPSSHICVDAASGGHSLSQLSAHPFLQPNYTQNVIFTL